MATKLAARKALAFAVLVGGLLGCGEIERPDGGRGLLPVGAKAPDFEATDAQGAKVRFSTVKGTRVVYFYPKDDTPRCTKEACAFRDAFQRYTDKGITIFGVSRDSEESHRQFLKTTSCRSPSPPTRAAAFRLLTACRARSRNRGARHVPCR